MFKKLIILFFLNSSFFIQPMMRALLDKDLLLGVVTTIPTLLSTTIQVFPSIKQDIGKIIGPDRLSWMIYNAPGPKTQLYIMSLQVVFGSIFHAYHEYKKRTNPLAVSRLYKEMAYLKYAEIAAIVMIHTCILWFKSNATPA
jgi:hypothetical protein